MELQTCQYCRFWKPPATKNNGQGNSGTCYFNPPHAVALPMINPLTREGHVSPVNVRPGTLAEDFCGHYQSMLEIK